MKKFLGMIFFVFLLISCGNQEVETGEIQAQKVKYVQTQSIETKTFSETLMVPGKVSPLQEVMISPLSSWVIQKILVKVWDRIKTWDILAQIDSASIGLDVNLNNAQNAYNNTLNMYNSSKEALEKNLSIAQLQYDNAVITKNNTYTSTQKQLELAQAQLDSIKQQQQNTQNTTSSSLDLAKQSVESAHISLDNFEKNSQASLESLEQKKSNLLDTMRVSLDGGFATMESGLIFVDTILWVTDKYRNENNAYEIYLWAKQTWLKQKTDTLFSQSFQVFTQMKWVYYKDMPQDQLEDFYAEFNNLNSWVVDVFDSFNQVLENTITSVALDDMQLATLKSTSKSFQWQVIALKSNLVGMLNSLKDLDQSISQTKIWNETQKASLVQALKMAELNYQNAQFQVNTSLDSIDASKTSTQIQLENTIASIEAQRDNADNAIKIAQNQLSSAQANYNSQLSSLKSQIDGASGQKNVLIQQLDNTSIRAPFDGVITQRNIEIGSMVSAWVQAFGIAGDAQKIIKSDVSAQNITYFSLWQEVQITKNKKVYTWVISLISESAHPTTKMYGVEIVLKNKEDAWDLILWDFVDIQIIKKSLWEEKIILPFSALIINTDRTYSVFIIWEDEKATKVNVEIWVSNSREVEVISWLEVWQRVVVSWALNLINDDVVEEIQK